MVYEVVTTLDGAEVLRRAKAFFAERVPMQAAFPEKEGRSLPDPPGTGGEEIALAVIAGARRHPGARLDAPLRSAGGPVPLDAAGAVGDGGVSATLPVRVMVQDAWDEVRSSFRRPRRSPTSSGGRSRRPRCAAIPPGTCSSSAAPSCATSRAPWPKRAWCPTAR